METPIFSHINFKSVYEPSEDTFLFLDALESELPFILSLNPTIIAEIGSGSGVNITSLNKSLGVNSVFCLASDINKDACLATKETSQINKATIEVFNMNMLDNFRKNIFDIILFNPPYVVTESDEICGSGIERAWAGGVKGREIMDKLFPKIPDLLTKNGVFYLVAIMENDPIEIVCLMEKFNFKSAMVKERKIRGEHLFVLKFQKI